MLTEHDHRMNIQVVMHRPQFNKISTDNQSGCSEEKKKSKNHLPKSMQQLVE